MKDPIQISSFHQDFLLSTEDTKKLLDIMSRSKTIDYIWDESRTTIGDRVSVDTKTFPSQKYTEITKAQTLGMTYEEYLNAERESKESLSTD